MHFCGGRTENIYGWFMKSFARVRRLQTNLFLKSEAWEHFQDEPIRRTNEASLETLLEASAQYQEHKVAWKALVFISSLEDVVLGLQKIMSETWSFLLFVFRYQIMVEIVQATTISNIPQMKRQKGKLFLQDTFKPIAKLCLWPFVRKWQQLTICSYKILYDSMDFTRYPIL